jgi:NAD(P)-dependent dehydrogenase (short-subunit alcohol dehydrogenase family)
LLTQLGAAPYSVTKHAAVGFAEWLAINYGDSGIGVSCVCPMGVDTPLLRAMFDSPQAEMRVAGAAVASAGAVIGPEAVAARVLQAIDEGTFLVLPHPEVLTMYRQKAADYDRWIAGMRRYQRTLG